METQQKFKLYTDGSYHEKENLAGFGGYIVTNGNKMIGKFSEVVSQPDLFKWHERLALKQGLELAISKGIKNITCYMDDLTLSIQAGLNAEDLGNSPKKYVILKEILQLKKQFDKIEFKHIPRSQNKMADKLASEAIKDIIDYFPSQNIGIAKKYTDYSNIAKDFTNFLVFDIGVDINVYYATKDVKTEKITTMLINTKKHVELPELVSLVTETLESFTHLSNLAICTYKNNGQELEDIINGRIPVFKARKELKLLENQFSKFQNIHYYMNEKVMKEIYENSPQLNYPKTQEEVLCALSELGNNYVLGQNIGIENHPNIKNSKRSHIKEIQQFYFNQFLTLGLQNFLTGKEDNELVGKTEIIKNKIVELREELESVLQNKGIQLELKNTFKHIN